MNVTFINPGKQGERFWDMVTETMQAAATDFNIKLEVIYAERNRVEMASLGIKATQREVPPDYLILVNEEQAAEKIILAAAEKKIKTLMLLSDFLPKQRDRVGFPGGKNPHLLGAITPDYFAAGKRMMTALLHCAEQKQHKTPYHVLAIGGDQLTPASIGRNEGALSVIKQHNELKLDRFLYANWNQKDAERLTRKYLHWAQQNQIIPSVIWAANDPIAFGAKAALEAHNLKAGEDVCLVGLNWSSEGLKLVKNGEMLLTDGGHFLGGAWSMVLLHDYHQQQLKGIDTPIGDIRFQMQSIDKTNINLYLSHLGNEQWNKIDFTQFALSDVDGSTDYDFSLEKVFSSIIQ
ncbi:ABC transporter substrate-binding protein [Neptuniibacter sp. QD34_54]|uniref:ABC transporter substrate-binding protein n=1 Tax=Neptuniibacter sp. QD34_54 TaxID=3398208 RepID=UPI0039F5165B